MVQETLLEAWRNLEAFEGRASVRAWLYRIATNRCLDALRVRSRRPREVQAMDDSPTPAGRTETVWHEPERKHPGGRRNTPLGVGRTACGSATYAPPPAGRRVKFDPG